MKLKFITVTFLLLFARGCDFYSTSLWFFEPGGMAGETNPLTRFLGVGWTGLIIVNVIIVSLILACYYYYLFHYRPLAMINKPEKLLDFASQLYFNEKGKLHRLLYKMPVNKKVFTAHLGYVMVWFVIVASFLATFHNLCQYYNVSFYNTYRDIVGRPLYVLYGLFILAFLWFQYKVIKKEYDETKGPTKIPS
ncbi:MAG: hypothetical protein SH808_07105 [Saprospiraceae bacterium]|nr:hypothetical protein [Saprospiraceae bacterium]